MTSMAEKIQLNFREEKILNAIKQEASFVLLAQQMKITMRTLQCYYLKTLLLKYNCKTIQELQNKIIPK